MNREGSPRLCFVVQRYGREVTGGAETLCREVAHRLSGKYRITLLTTCALDYLTWNNHYPPGISSDGGLELVRFPVRRPRKVRSFGRLSVKLYNNPHTLANEVAWMERQGPDAPDLLRWIEEHRDDFGLWLFFTYLYPTTFFGLPRVAGKSVLVPMAHPEEPLGFDIFDYLFHLPRGMIFNTPEERDLVHERFSCGYIPDTVARTGLDIPPGDPPPPLPAPEKTYLLYAGRLDIQKGMEELFRFYSRFAGGNEGAPGLILAGDRKMPIPGHPGIRYLGYLSEEDKTAAMAHCLAVVVPSPHESLSITALEAWSLGRPVLANGLSDVLAGQCRRSGGGLAYTHYEEFESSLNRLLRDAALREDLGSRGREFVEKNYSWETIEGIYTSYIDRMLREVSRPGEEDIERP